MAEYNDTSAELIRYLVDACPGSLEKKSTAGDTPLMVAFRLGRPRFAKILLEANANQTTKNLQGENLVHAAIAGKPPASKLGELLDLIDDDLRTHLFLQRKNLKDNGTTPLHEWISLQPHAWGYQQGLYHYGSKARASQDSNDVTLDTLRLLLVYSKGDELEMLDGAGDTCLHTAIMKGILWVVKALVDFKPQLLCRENAVGRTPAEVAHGRLVAKQLAKPGNLVHAQYNNYHQSNKFVGLCRERFEKTMAQTSVTAAELGLGESYSARDLSRIAKAMRHGAEEESEALAPDLSAHVMWDLCCTTLQRRQDVRRLVSLNEANDVARRLGESYASASRYFSVHGRRDEDQDSVDGKSDKEDAQPNQDFVATELASRLRLAWGRGDNQECQNMNFSWGWCQGCGNYHD
jgi:hypothetical protein